MAPRKPCTWTPAASLSVRDSERSCAIPLAAAISGGCCSSCAGSPVSLIWMLLSTALVPCIASEVESVHCAIMQLCDAEVSALEPGTAQLPSVYIGSRATLPAVGHFGAGAAGRSAAACGQRGCRAGCWVLMTSRAAARRCCVGAAAQWRLVLLIQAPCLGSSALAAGRHWQAKRCIARHQALACCCCWQALPQMCRRLAGRAASGAAADGADASLRHQAGVAALWMQAGCLCCAEAQQAGVAWAAAALAALEGSLWQWPAAALD